MEVYKKVDVRESTLKTLSWVWTYIQCPKSSFFIRDLNCFTSRTIAAQPFSIKSVVYCIYLSIEWSNICGFNVVIEWIYAYRSCIVHITWTREWVQCTVYRTQSIVWSMIIIRYFHHVFFFFLKSFRYLTKIQRTNFVRLFSLLLFFFVFC